LLTVVDLAISVLPGLLADPRPSAGWSAGGPGNPGGEEHWGAGGGDPWGCGTEGRGMNRRAFLSILSGGLLAAPLAAGAQSAGKVPRIGYLSLFPRSDPWGQRGVDTFWRGLRDLGHVEVRP